MAQYKAQHYVGQAGVMNNAQGEVLSVVLTHPPVEIEGQPDQPQPMVYAFNKVSPTEEEKAAFAYGATVWITIDTDDPSPSSEVQKASHSAKAKHR